MTGAGAARRIVVCGVGKSGTSALHQCILQGAQAHFQAPVASLVEPRTEAALRDFMPVLGVAKVLAERLWLMPGAATALDGFDRQVLIVRDPRDAIVSRLVWQVATRLAQAPREQAARIEAAFEQKQRDPASLSVFDLCRLAGGLTEAGDDYPEACRRLAYGALDLLAAYPGAFVCRYESFVDGRLADLAAYVGFVLPHDVALPGKSARVRRAAQHGGWLDWFVPQDHDYFVAPMRRELEALGYIDTPKPDHVQVIMPEASTLYIRRLSADARAGG